MAVSKGSNMAAVQPKMKDVAAMAGVSIKTVSRVLNNEPHVQHALRERVRSAVDELGYVPSKSARTLRGNRSYSINMICHDESSNYFNAIQFGAVIACQKRGYQLTISLIAADDLRAPSDMKSAFERLMRDSRPDGVLLVAPLVNNADVIKAFRALDVPLALIGPTDIKGEAVRVAINDREAARQVTEHLLELGHTRVGFVRGKEDHAATEERFQGYLQALQAHGIVFDPELVCRGMFDALSGAEAAEKLLDLKAPATAIFASNDYMAAGIMKVAQQRRLKVPDALSIVGFDDSEVARYMWPMLTTVRQPLQQLGEVAAFKLIERLGQSARPKNSPIILPHEIIIRQSTAPSVI